MQKYYKQYKWENIFTMIRNLKRDPEICTEDFKGKLVVITGATSGIGKATAEKYATHGADILCVNRNEEKSKVLCEYLKKEYQASCSYLIADFSSLADVHAVSKKLALLDRNIDVLIHNAGAFFTKRTLTDDGMEMVFQTNYLSTFIINQILTEKFIKQGKGRIIYVNSEGYRFAAWGLHLDDLSWEQHSYSGSKGYGSAKLAQLLSMIKFNDLFAGSGVTINAMHPGNVKSNTGQNNGPLYKFLKKTLIESSARSANIAAEALYFLGVSDKVKNISGKFFNLTTLEEPAPPALDREAADMLWETSLVLGGIK